MKNQKIKGLVFILGVLFVLTGCGSNTSDTEKAQEKEATGTHLFKAANGEIEVPNNPKRVVVRTYMGHVLALDVPVVGATEWDLASPFIDKKVLDKIKDVGVPMNAEEVLALEPDLIITDTEDEVASLEKIAPTVLLPYDTVRNINESVDLFGELLNRKTEAEAWKKSFKENADKERARLAEVNFPMDATVGLYELQDSKLFVFGSNFGRGGQVLTTGLGLKQQDNIQKVSDGDGWKELSLEALPDYAADFMFFTSYTANGTESAELTALKANPIWKTIPAVEKNQVIELPFEKMYYYDPIAIQAQLKLITDKLIETQK
ncbi:MAG: ABC transporter substrate-binding protein [Carnobacterium sp.]|uniref:ABC transporter substrate-binding protein n=2 Tax=Carnobacterium maltaromaticum TaxID=2751 RepID=A0AAW9JRJ4_CARML|nr:ABC transporter substrate-binding protein [Carnobacterium maltaromaticum]KRN72259.1 iron compound ABC transporter, iron compound-binding protein [Carnobacterium maltaromaticum]KRN84001.1 iron compound ABC transporter, iron compound-binding protein [Carnobacterium maltaromaticum]MDT1943548.1 ABC transporter substrate-binding protein [Carnobacterium maltaromaticum]MDT1998928.1 ABC transporter substrate-binding protein [Carnobacterium maltaromaticum]MDW5524572.1 ABC transporter substrate-bindi